MEEASRGAILTGLRAGKTNAEIAAFNSLSLQTVQFHARAYKKFLDEGGDDKDYSIARKSHQQSAQHNDQVEAIQELIDDDPDRSVREVARELGCAKSTVARQTKGQVVWRYRLGSTSKGRTSKGSSGGRSKGNQSWHQTVQA